MTTVKQHEGNVNKKCKEKKIGNKIMNMKSLKFKVKKNQRIQIER
jgi:hypothetical protein